MSDVEAPGAWAQRYRAWYLGTAQLRAETVVRLDDELVDGAFAVLDPTYPRSFDSNRLVLPTLTGIAADPAAVIAVADDVLGGVGLAHRCVGVYDDVPAGWADPLLAAGWQRQDLVGMACDLATSPADGAPAAVVVEVGEDRAAPFVDATWRAAEPTFDDATVGQLVRRRRRLDRAGAVHRLAVAAPAADGAPGGLAAQADLVVRSTTAELDAVTTLAAYRGLGYGDALVASAQQLARTAGADLLVLEALTDDWPREWYARRGFVDVASSSSFTLLPAD